MYVYLKSEPKLWTVGFYKSDGTFYPETDHHTQEDAAKRVAWLNGSREAQVQFKEFEEKTKPPGKHPLRFGKKYIVLEVSDNRLEDMLNSLDRDGYFLKEAFRSVDKGKLECYYTLIAAKRERG